MVVVKVSTSDDGRCLILIQLWLVQTGAIRVYINRLIVLQTIVKWFYRISCDFTNSASSVVK